MEPEELRRTFASNVRKYRKQQQLTQVVLAAKADTDSRYIQSIEAGEQVPSVLIAYRIAVALRVKLDDLFT